MEKVGQSSREQQPYRFRTGAARLNKNGDNPTCQSGALLAKMDNADFCPQIHTRTPLREHATLWIIEHFLPGCPVDT